MWSKDTYHDVIKPSKVHGWSRRETVRRIIDYVSSAGPGDIVLMHNEIDLEAVEAVIQNLQAQGMELVGVDRMLGLPRLTPPQPSFPQTGLRPR